MKAILTYTTMIDGKAVEQTRLFDTTKAKRYVMLKTVSITRCRKYT